MNGSLVNRCILVLKTLSEDLEKTSETDSTQKTNILLAKATMIKMVTENLIASINETEMINKNTPGTNEVFVINLLKI